MTFKKKSLRSLFITAFPLFAISFFSFSSGSLSSYQGILRECKMIIYLEKWSIGNQFKQREYTYGIPKCSTTTTQPLRTLASSLMT